MRGWGGVIWCGRYYGAAACEAMKSGGGIWCDFEDTGIWGQLRVLLWERLAVSF